MDAITSWPRRAPDTPGWNAAHSAPQRLGHDHRYFARFRFTRGGEMLQPYPDAAQVSDYQQLTAPRSVRTAVKIMYAGAGASVLHAIAYVATQGAGKAAIERRYPHMPAGTVSTLTHVMVIAGVVVCLFGAVGFAWTARSCKSGRNWARVTATVLLVLGVLAAVYDLVSPRAAAVTIISFVVCLIGLAAVALLWRGSSSAYFKLFTRPQL
jgi:hypothetical protein